MDEFTWNAIGTNFAVNRSDLSSTRSTGIPVTVTTPPMLAGISSHSSAPTGTSARAALRAEGAFGVHMGRRLLAGGGYAGRAAST